MTQESPLIEAVDQRIFQNLPLIQRAMESRRDSSKEDFAEGDRMTGLNRSIIFDSRFLSLSEMPICGALTLPFWIEGPIK